MKIATIVGARPQFIKAAAVSRAILRQAGSAPDSISEIIIHTGQHYDHNMSQVFFDELSIPHPLYNLGVGGGTHGQNTGRMLEGIEKILMEEQPDWVLVYGDTDSTLAGALSAAKLDIPVAHVEAGLRSYNRRMPEEINRVMADHLSSLLFCPTPTAVKNLASEGITKGVMDVGDVMFDVSIFYRDKARAESMALERLGVTQGAYVLATIHRAENTGDPARLGGIVKALAQIARETPVILPLHPRTVKALELAGGLKTLAGVKVTEPLPFLDMVWLEQSAMAIITDSGGVQKEAFFYGVPCVTARDETEWVETVESGWNTLAGADTQKIISAWSRIKSGHRPATAPAYYGDGAAADRIVDVLMKSA
ncbi:MAG: UDP-N-acetylglucosamine 2-epimerase (non-hydrolyzing) [Nitrospinae bacterium]|nr:UDP-N-acetylglucosamine 2-epimerase (non-hydrolyzing) [Nitrospinota bacterium]